MNQQKSSNFIADLSVSTIANNPAAVVDLWTQYWNHNPLIDFWQLQTLTRTTCYKLVTLPNNTSTTNEHQNAENNTHNNNVISESDPKKWSPEIKRMIQVTANDLRARQIRTYFSSTSNAQHLSSVVEIATSPATLNKPQEIFDLFQTFVCGQHQLQQTTVPPILDFQFYSAPATQVSTPRGTSGKKTFCAARITFAHPSIAERVVYSLQGIADARVMSVAETSSRKLKSNVLLLRGGTNLVTLHNTVKFQGLNLLFAIFGYDAWVVKFLISGNSVPSFKINFTCQLQELQQRTRSPSSTEPAVNNNNNNNDNNNIPKSLLFDPTESLTTNLEDAATSKNKLLESEYLTPNFLKVLSSTQESALYALLALQRPLAEDWGLMLTYDFEEQ